MTDKNIISLLLLSVSVILLPIVVRQFYSCKMSKLYNFYYETSSESLFTHDCKSHVHISVNCEQCYEAAVNLRSEVVLIEDYMACGKGECHCMLLRSHLSYTCSLGR